MSDGAGQCAQCGRPRWAGERFCPGCGAEQAATDGTPDLIDLDGHVQEASGEPGRSGGRESLIGIAVLAAIIAGIALLFTLGNNAVEDLTAPDSPPETATPIATATPELAPAPTPRATPVATVNIPTTPRPGTVLPTVTAAPASDQIDALQKAVVDLDLGAGWIVAIDDPRQPSVINLETGERISTTSPFLSPRTNVVLAATEGIYLATTTGIVTTWSLVPWDGSPAKTAARFDNAETPFGREPVWYFMDEDVGPVVVHLVGSDTLRLHALALRTGESRRIRLDDPIQIFLTGAVFEVSGLRSIANALLLDSGGSIWRWTFNGDWDELAEGAVRLMSGSSAVAVTCDGPSACGANLIDTQSGATVADLPNYALNLDPIVGRASLISPDNAHIAQFSNLTGPSYQRPDISIYDTATGETRQIGRADFNWWELIAWSPNSKFLLVNGEAGIAAIDVSNDETHLLTENRFASGPASSMQLTIVPTIDR